MKATLDLIQNLSTASDAIEFQRDIDISFGILLPNANVYLLRNVEVHVSGISISKDLKLLFPFY